MTTRKFVGLATAMLVGILVLSSLAGRTVADTAGITQTQTSQSYRIELDIQPATTMLTPAQAASATSGEVMVETPNMVSDMSMPAMSGSATTPGMSSMSAPGGASPMSMMQMATTDGGQPVNHHLEVHIYDKTTAAVIADPVPTITLTDSATGATRTLSSVMGMYDIQVGTSDLHFGNNVYLQDGDPYTIQVMDGPEMVTFANVIPTGGMGLSTSTSGSMGSMSSMPSSMPTQSMP